MYCTNCLGHVLSCNVQPLVLASATIAAVGNHGWCILPVEVKEDLIQRLKRPPLSRNRFRYVNTQLPQVTIPSDMANKATLSLYSSIAQCNGNGHDRDVENGVGPTIEASSTMLVKNTIN